MTQSGWSRSYEVNLFTAPWSTIGDKLHARFCTIDVHGVTVETCEGFIEVNGERGLLNLRSHTIPYDRYVQLTPRDTLRVKGIRDMRMANGCSLIAVHRLP